jgi:hypothetical protein
MANVSRALFLIFLLALTSTVSGRASAQSAAPVGSPASLWVKAAEQIWADYSLAQFDNSKISPMLVLFNLSQAAPAVILSAAEQQRFLAPNKWLPVDNPMKCLSGCLRIA